MRYLVTVEYSPKAAPEQCHVSSGTVEAKNPDAACARTREVYRGVCDIKFRKIEAVS